MRSGRTLLYNYVKNSLISIIIPVYNGESYLEKSIDSCLAQTYKNVEIIIVDDGSTDRTKEIIQNYISLYPNIIRSCCHHKNKKLGAARNTGIKKAKGEFLIFVDGDDYIDMSMCDVLLNKQQNTHADIVCSDVYVMNGSQKKISTTIPNVSLPGCDFTLIRWMDCSACAKLIRRKIIIENDLFFPEGIFYEDSAVVPVWMLVALKVEKVKEPLYFYVQRKSSICHSITNIEKELDALISIEYLHSKLTNMGLVEKYKNAFSIFSAMRVRDTWIRILNKHCGGNVNSFCKMQKVLKKYADDINENPYFWMCYNENEIRFLLSLKEDDYPTFSYKLNCGDAKNSNLAVNYFISQLERVKKILCVISAGFPQGVILWGMGKRGQMVYGIIKDNSICEVYAVDQSKELIGNSLRENDVIYAYEDVKDKSEVILTTSMGVYIDIYERTRDKTVINIIWLLRMGVF
jgi:glycosyltransferase involved in cell wall biosynthesis